MVHIEDARAPHSPLGTPATTATAASRPETGHSSSGDHPLPPEQWRSWHGWCPRPGSPDAMSGREWEAAPLFSCQPSLEKPALQPLPLISSKADTLADKRRLLSAAASSEHFLAQSIDLQWKNQFPYKVFWSLLSGLGTLVHPLLSGVWRWGRGGWVICQPWRPRTHVSVWTESFLGCPWACGLPSFVATALTKCQRIS